MATPPPAPDAPTAPTGQRLAKRVAELLPCSRSEAEQYIEGGWVSVDGQVVEEPQFRVLPGHTVAVAKDDNLADLTPVTLLLHKPPGYEDSTDLLAFTRAGKRPPLLAGRLLTMDSHWAEDSTGLRVLKRHFVKQAVQVPLETGASGLLVFTQDWRVARKLTEDASVLEHEFMVEVAGTPSPEQLALLNSKHNAGDAQLPPIKVSLSSNQGDKAKLRFAVKGAHPGLVDHLCQRVGWQLLGMHRLRISRVALAHLPQGQWRYLGAWEKF